MFREQPHEPGRFGPLRVVDDHQRVAPADPDPLLDGGVEGDAGVPGDDARLRAVGAAAFQGGGEAGHGAVRHLHALGAAGGAGGVDDVGGVERVRGELGRPVLVGVGAGPEHRHAGRYGRLGVGADDGGEAGVGGHEGDPLGGVGRVEGDVRGAGPPGGEQRDRQIRGPGEVHPDPVPPSHPGPSQSAGQAGGPPVQLGEVEAGVHGVHEMCIRDSASRPAGAAAVAAAVAVVDVVVDGSAKVVMRNSSSVGCCEMDGSRCGAARATARAGQVAAARRARACV